MQIGGGGWAVARLAVMASLATALILAPLGCASARKPVAVDQTLAFRLLRAEAAARPLPPGREAELRTLLQELFAGLGPDPKPPADADGFVHFAEDVASGLAKRNFIQPAAPADWVDSFGEVLTPVPADHPQFRRGPAGPAIAIQMAFANRTKPFHFIDCDMAAAVLISVAQMVGFDLRMVEAPRHAFVQWRDPKGHVVNWDWGFWTSRSIADYRVKFAITPAEEARGIYLVPRSPSETYAYFLAGISHNLGDPAAALALRRKAATLAPNNRLVAGNMSEALASAPGLTPQERRDALPYALVVLAADAGRPEMGGAALQAVACAQAARGDWDLAVPIGRRAVRDALPEQAERFRSDLSHIEQHQLC